MDIDWWRFENAAYNSGSKLVTGIDEAGRGPLAGPVVAAAVLLPQHINLPGINDSKKLSPSKRELLYELIYNKAVTIGIGIIDAAIIDKINILQGTLLAMRIAVEYLFPAPDYILIDGISLISSNIPQQPIPKGDSLSISIAAASIVAKVTRDRLMKRYSEDFPEYGFQQHMGYGTSQHLEAIKKLGACPIHRKTFRGVK
ncbi:MAG: ribonuclease HII [Pseudomonadota bacterium]